MEAGREGALKRGWQETTDHGSHATTTDGARNNDRRPMGLPSDANAHRSPATRQGRGWAHCPYMEGFEKLPADAEKC